MPPRNTDGLIRFGVLALPLAGLLALAGLYSTFKLGTGGILASGENRAIISAGYFVSQLLGNGLALTVLIFGVIALYAYLANSRESFGFGRDGIEHRRDRPDPVGPGRLCLRRPGP